MPRSTPLTRSWEQQVREAFLRAYAERVKGSPLYGSFDAARPLLELFELEKAFYELRYELSHRPIGLLSRCAGFFPAA